MSVRLSNGDIRNIKRFAKRIGVRDSDIIRFAIKSVLSRLGPLCDPTIRGRSLVPVLVESGDEFIRHFEFDAFQLESIINDQADPKDQVERDDIVLLAMSSLQQDYLRMRLHADGQTGAPVTENSLRRYLYDKYIYRDGGASGATAVTGDGVARHDMTSSPQTAARAR
ncbi:MAG: hypothetical protein WDM77_01715 [Steroidobacteraceae bacterium]